MKKKTPTMQILLIVLCLSGASVQSAVTGRASRQALDGCPPPDVEVLVNGSYVKSDGRRGAGYTDVTEVKFSAEIGPRGELKQCKIKCIGGQWHGPLCRHEEDGGRYHPLLRSCRLEQLPPNTVLMYRNETVTPESFLTFPHGALLSARCLELGVYKLLGVATLTCLNGAWSHRIPSCIPTTMITNYTEDSPPTILIRIPSGSGSVEPSGSLAVFPGSIVHLECLFLRKIGNPEWTWTSTFRQYLSGWAIAADEREWKYRLSVYYTKQQDSGVYSCSTPRGITNSITLRVAAVHCDPIETPDRSPLTSRVEGSHLGHMAVFQCPIGFRLVGSANLTCQASGRWSSPSPTCEAITCPAIVDLPDPHLAVVEQNTGYRGRAVFKCLWGYQLVGEPGVECEVTGQWSAALPTCRAIECPPPLAPINGRLVTEGPTYKVGKAVLYSCNDHHQLIGDASIVCTDTGFWSHPPPFCKARCSYPGDPPNGRIAPVKFSYEPGDHLKVTCTAGFVTPMENNIVTCLPGGLWSQPLPPCKSYVDI